MTNFYDQYKIIQPYLQKKTEVKRGQYQNLQSVEDRKKLVHLCNRVPYVLQKSTNVELDLV